MMDNINLILSKNLKHLRNERKLSLDKLADLTGISKTMLGQIERGESNPSITTVWKIANGLKISFTALISEPPADAVVVPKSKVQVLEESNHYRLYPFFPYEGNRNFEVYTVEIETGGELSSAPHREGTEEFITVFEGEMVVKVSEETYTVKAGDSIRFKADRPHIYYNLGETLVRMNMIIYYSV
ncbi:helix-turn-helix domain-containing protein [Paenibacillus polymyxa]|uniref:helix-turn-helix domain-containing protein n=1 Tax=Paenibacillus polymyxa TaxID=1406 RepID=UPI003217787A